MKRVQESQMKMYKLVAHFFEEHSELCDSNTVLKKHLAEFLVCIEQIDQYFQAQAYNNKGYTVNKQKAKKDLSTQVFKLSAGFCSFGVDHKNYVLVQEFKIAESHINKKSDADIVNYAAQLSISLKEYIGQLADYRILSQDIDDLEALTVYYQDVLHLPSELRKHRNIATRKIQELITKAYHILKKSIDRDMVHYKDKQAQIYKLYTKRREVYDAAFRALSIIGKTQNADDNSPLQYVRISVKTETGKELAIVPRVSSKKGNYRFKGIPDGTYTVTFEAYFYRSQTVKCTVHHQKASRINVLMKKEAKGESLLR